MNAGRHAVFDLWPENDAPLSLLLAMQTQWRVGGMKGEPLGLDYSVLPFVMKQIGVADRDESSVFHGLRIAEQEVLRVLNDR
ncbi:DUF1799 domain-containing protein [Dechloromonas sp. TW-R-39-2]|uniref:DUF1799 domain-containing protein n=1 Tax=Dechloromonas sp. TW-R-39-2 TaxID=2654218 RepID=UPI00193DF892|nr:DUF1799 domain-containing protein [Dechloromonas sp. TW-R-39-2]